MQTHKIKLSMHTPKKACKGTELNLPSLLSWPLRLGRVIIFTPWRPYRWESLLSPSNWVGSKQSLGSVAQKKIVLVGMKPRFRGILHVP